jgi:uncharacterized repeat protein (TIGR01451 family)
VTITNPGTGIAANVQIEAAIPEGLEHARGKRLIMEVGNLNPGESRSVRLALAATRGGQHHVEVQARSASGLIQTAASDVTVVAPSLQVDVQGPSLRYLGRQGVFRITVENEGSAATDNVQVRYKIPSGFEFVSSDRGAQFDPATGLLTWFAGRLEGDEEASMNVTLLAREAGEFEHLIRATSEHGALSDTDLTTVVEGTPSLVIEVKDLEDPVEVNSETAYEVRVKNEGTAPARSIGIACELAKGMTFLNAEGPAEHICDGSSVIFRAIPELGAGQSVTLKIRVSAASAGSLRFRAHLSSESIAEPLTAEELTKFYGE